MKLNQGALMKALGVGAGAGVVIGVVRNIPLVGIACCCIGWALWVAVGAAYGYFDGQEGNAPDTGQYALGGAAAGAAGGVVWGLVSGLVTLVLSLLGVTAAGTAAIFQQLQSAGVDVPPQLASQAAGTAGVGVVGIITSICTGLIAYAILGAIGGLVYALVRNNQTPKAAAPPPAM